MSPPTYIKGNTVRLDIGGHNYTVSRSLIELFPNSMLARLISDEWEQCKKKRLFIDRNGHRFQYVLDYMRDQQEVNLPMTESMEAVRKELDYFGLLGDCGKRKGSTTNSSSKRLKITVGNPAEAGEMMAAIAGNVHEELDEIHKNIRACKTKIKRYGKEIRAVKLAQSLFERSVAQHGRELNAGRSFKIRIGHWNDMFSFDYHVAHVLEFFDKKLASYGLLLVSPRTAESFRKGPIDFELKSTKSLK